MRCCIISAKPFGMPTSTPNLSLLNVEIWDATGNRRQVVELPADAPVERIIAVLIEKLRFPRNGPDGHLLSYKLQHRTTGRQLLDSDTPLSAGVKSGDVMRLIPEITAGVIMRRS